MIIPKKKKKAVHVIENGKSTMWIAANEFHIGQDRPSIWIEGNCVELQPGTFEIEVLDFKSGELLEKWEGILGPGR